MMPVRVPKPKTRRPTAWDRCLADIFRKMRPGEYTVRVEPDHVAPLKAEGWIAFYLEDKLYNISPKKPPLTYEEARALERAEYPLMPPTSAAFDRPAAPKLEGTPIPPRIYD